MRNHQIELMTKRPDKRQHEKWQPAQSKRTHYYTQRRRRLLKIKIKTKTKTKLLQK